MNEKTLIKVSYLFGILIPLGETLRRGKEIGYIPNYIDDYLIGLFLILAARSVQEAKPLGKPILVAAWAALCGGLYYSFTGQFLFSKDISGLANEIVIIIKAILYLLAIYFCYQAIRNASKNG